VAELRATAQSLPFHAALKAVLCRRGVPASEDVRRPLPTLDAHGRRKLEHTVEGLSNHPSTGGSRVA
jgi:dihydrodipicolinate synthase/N-acetylneuraminate lyase